MTRNDLTERSAIFADLMLLFAVLGWAISFPIAKLAMNDWGEHKYFFLAGRFWIAFAIFGIWAASRYSWKEIYEHFKPGFWVGIVLSVTFGFQYTAIRAGSAGEVAFVTALNSVFVPIGMLLVFRKPVGWVIWVGIAIATVGALMVGYEDSGVISNAAWLAIISAVGMAADLILIHYFLKQKNEDGTAKYEQVPFLATQFLVVAVATTLLTAATEIPFHGFPAWSEKAIFAMVFMAIVATAAAFLVQTKFQPMTTPERAALVFLLEPPLAAFFGWLVLGEHFTSLMVIGAVMIIGGVALAEILSLRPPPPPPIIVTPSGLQ